MKLSTLSGAVAVAASGQGANKLKCDISTILNVHCSATNDDSFQIGTVATDNEGLSDDCQALLATSAEFEIRTSGTELDPNDCLLGDLAADISLDIFTNEETKCWSKSDAYEQFLQFSTDVYLFDKNSDIRPWAQVPLQCDIPKDITVTPLSVSLAYGELDNVGTTADPVSLSIKAIIDDTDTVLTTPASLPLGAVAYFFVEAGLSSQLDLVLGTCTYKGDPVTETSDYVMAMSNDISTAYSFASDVVGFTMQIYQNAKASENAVHCDVTIGFASD